MGTGGMNEIFMSILPFSLIPGMHGNGWEWVGTGERFKWARPEQALFLARINQAGGLGFMARDCRDVMRELENNQRKSNDA